MRFYIFIISGPYSSQEGFKAKNDLFIKLKLRDTVELIFVTERYRSVDCGGGPRCAGSKIAGEGLNSHR